MGARETQPTDFWSEEVAPPDGSKASLGDGRIDVPVPAPGFDPADISTRRFATGRRGYSPDEVDAFLRDVAEHLSRLRRDLDVSRSQVEELERRMERADETAYSRISLSFAEMIRRADHGATEVRTAADASARATVAAAHAEADRIVAEAHDTAEHVIVAAREESSKLRADAESVRAASQAVRAEAESIRSQAQAAREDAEGLRGEAESMRAQAASMRAQAAGWRSQVLEEHRRMSQARPVGTGEVTFDLPDVDFTELSRALGDLSEGP